MQWSRKMPKASPGNKLRGDKPGTVTSHSSRPWWGPCEQIPVQLLHTLPSWDRHFQVSSGSSEHSSVSCCTAISDVSCGSISLFSQRLMETAKGQRKAAGRREARQAANPCVDMAEKAFLAAAPKSRNSPPPSKKGEGWLASWLLFQHVGFCSASPWRGCGLDCWPGLPPRSLPCLLAAAAGGSVLACTGFCWRAL